MHYSDGVSEGVLAKAIKKYNWRRDDTVVATKASGVVGLDTKIAISKSYEDRELSGYINKFAVSRRHIFDSVETGLRRLDLDYISLSQLHCWNLVTSAEEVVEAVHDVVMSGRVRYIVCIPQTLN